MTGLVIGGPWLTAALAGLCARALNGASPLLASRRLADDPKAVFRAVRGLVLAVFLGTIVGGLVPTLDSLAATPNSQRCTTCSWTPSLSRPARARHAGTPAAGLTPQAGANLTEGLRAIPGTGCTPGLPAAGGQAGLPGTVLGVVSCPVMRDLAVLGQCAPGPAGRAGPATRTPALQRQPAQQHRGVRRREQSRLHRGAWPRCRCRRSWSG